MSRNTNPVHDGSADTFGESGAAPREAAGATSDETLLRAQGPQTRNQA